MRCVLQDSGSNNGQVRVLLSGGIDSTTLLCFHKGRHANVTGMFLDYGQAGASRELVAAQAVAAHYDIHLQSMQIRGVSRKQGGLIVGRNGFLLMSALIEFGTGCGSIAIGIHRGCDYMDCSKSFIEKSQDLFDLYTSGMIHISTPFLEWTKPQSWQYALKHRVPLNLTYSCELGKDQPCGECRTCQDLEELSAI